jgi:ferredoxin-NADP reductase
MAAQHTDLAHAQVFASGNSAMIDDGRKCAVSLGLPAARFFADAFTAS